MRTESQNADEVEGSQRPKPRVPVQYDEYGYHLFDSFVSQSRLCEFEHYSFMPMTQVIYPVGKVCISRPLLTVQPSLAAPHCFIKACISSALRVRSEETIPSKTRTKGNTGMIYVKKRWPGDLQK
jgi:hypothetical protein